MASGAWAFECDCRLPNGKLGTLTAKAFAQDGFEGIRWEVKYFLFAVGYIPRGQNTEIWRVVNSQLKHWEV